MELTQDRVQWRALVLAVLNRGDDDKYMALHWNRSTITGRTVPDDHIHIILTPWSRVFLEELAVEEIPHLSWKIAYKRPPWQTQTGCGWKRSWPISMHYP